MAARKAVEGAVTTETMPSATVRPVQYAAGVGWEVGQRAPSDAYRQYDQDGAVVGPVVYEHPGGGAVQIVAEGGLVTDGVARAIDEASDTDESDEG